MIPAPKIDFAFGDFYRFIMSIGIVLVALPFITLVVLARYISENPGSPAYFAIFCMMAASAAIGIVCALWAGKRWYANQKFMDKRLEASARRADRLIRNMTEEERNADIRKDILDENQTSAEVFTPDDNLKEKSTDAEQKAARFREIKSSDSLQTYKLIEDGTLEYLQNLFPDLRSHAALPTPSGTLTFDAVVQGWEETTIIEIRILRSRTHSAMTLRMFDDLENSIARLRDSILSTGFPVDVKFNGLLVIVSDLDALGRTYIEHLRKQFSNLALKRNVRINTLFVDIRDIDF